jgi:predicted nucleic acid-binding protein
MSTGIDDADDADATGDSMNEEICAIEEQLAAVKRNVERLSEADSATREYKARAGELLLAIGEIIDAAWELRVRIMLQGGQAYEEDLAMAVALLRNYQDLQERYEDLMAVGTGW